MKKIFALLLMLILVFSAAACSSDDTGQSAEPSEQGSLQKAIQEAEKKLNDKTSSKENDSLSNKDTKDTDEAETETETETETEGTSDASGGTAPQEEKEYVLDFMVEGEKEQLPAEAVAGTGYNLLLPKDEWICESPDFWVSSYNEDVKIWVDTVDSFDPNDQTASAEEWMTNNIGEWYFDEDREVYNISGDYSEMYLILAEIKTDGKSCFLLCYSRPASPEYEEGWGSRLRTIANSFQINPLSIPSSPNRQ